MIQPTVAFVEQLSSQLSMGDQFTLIERLARRTKLDLAATPLDTRKPISLRGMWKDNFAEDFDIEAMVREIRSEWLKDLAEMEEP